MHQLVVNPETPQAWQIQLKRGTNLLGRGPASDFKLDDPSVSSSHCQIIVENGTAVIKDLGSTNGTLVNRVRVSEALLQPGQMIELGAVKMLFQPDAHAAVNAGQVQPPPAPKPAIRVTAKHAPPAPEAVEAAPPPPPVMPMAAAGPAHCKSHIKTPARWMCTKCRRTFCDLCVTTRNVGGVPKTNCRSCGGDCLPLQVHLARSTGPRGFFTRLPGAFVYPFRGTGLLVLIACTILLAALKFFGGGSGVRGSFLIRGFGWGLIAQVFVGGYLFSYLQSIIHSTAAEDNEMPGLPSMAKFRKEILLPFLRLLGLGLVCFGPTIALYWLAVEYEQPAAGIAMIPAALLGGLYFPMAFLAVAMLNSVAAANPLLVVPSIFKVPLQYLLAVLLLGMVVVVQSVGNIVLEVLFPDSLHALATQSVPNLCLIFGVRAFWSFFGVYLLTVNARILGLLYLTKKDKLGWFNR